MKLKLIKISNNDGILLKNIIGTVILKGMAILVSFFSTTAYIKYFSNSEILGVWFTILSILQWILTFDFGIGNGLRNKIIPYLDLQTNSDKMNIKKYISSAYFSIIFLSIVVTIVGVFLIKNVNWNVTLNISTSILKSEILQLTILITFLGIILQFIMKIVLSILYALRMNVLASSTTLISSIILCVYLFLPFSGNIKYKLIALSFVYAITIILPLVVVSFYVFKRRLPGCSPNIKFYDRKIAKEVLGIGGYFFIIQLELLLLISTDSWLVSNLFTSKEVVEYQVYYRLFSLPTTIFALISQPLWSSYAVEKEKKNFKWIKEKDKIVNKFALLISIFCILECLISPWLINIWVGIQNCKINNMAAIAFGLLSIGQLFMYASTSLANGLGKLKCQAICNSIAIFIKFVLCFSLAKKVNNWAFIIYTECIGTLLVAIIQPLCNRSYLRELEKGCK